MQFALTVSVLVLMTGLAACARDPASGSVTDAVVATTASVAVEPASDEHMDAHQPADGKLPLVVVYKSPTCGCCESWVGHMQGAGFPVEIRQSLRS